MNKQRNVFYAFGPFTLDAGERVLRREGQIVALPPKALEVLCFLVEAQGRVVNKAELLDNVWPGTFVEEANLTQSIFLVRKCLGQEYIETLPKRGYRFAGEIRIDEPAPARRLLLPRRAAVAAVILTISTAAASWWYLSRSAPIRSIAVLPFSNLSGDASYDYIGDGLCEELTHALMGLGGVRVAARTSAFQFRGKNTDVRKIGELLNVAALLEGSTRTTGNTIRVTAQLVDARTGYHIWSETYDGNLDDVLGIQQRIGAAVAGRLAQDIPGSHLRVPAPSREVSLAYLRGRYFLAKGRPETFRQAVECFQEVISKDPKYARAYSGLADTHYRWALWESLPPAAAFAEARRAAEQALALDETLAEAHASLANVKFQYDWDYASAEREFRRSIALDPNRADTWHWFSHLLTAIGRFAESLEASKKAIEVEPFDVPSQNHLGWSYYFAGDYDRAIEQHRKVLELDPIHGQTRLLLGRALLQKDMFGEATEQLRKNLELSPESPERIAALAYACAVSGAPDDARQLLDRLLALARQRYVSAYSIATVYAGLGAKRQTLEYLDKASAEHASRVVEVKYEPIFKKLRSEPSFQALLERIGL
ncbi:MAG: winged helix-turn-helix domain-containing protein [Acidobacteria bacterium]|nr:winged helix-turn-helix domain-containing protein [Acidobacteriota bacterium]